MSHVLIFYAGNSERLALYYPDRQQTGCQHHLEWPYLFLARPLESYPLADSTPVPPMTLTPGTLLGQYQIIAPLGAGGMGEVYCAQDTRLGRRVALKLLLPKFTNHEDLLARFKREARAILALNHPNIITIHEIAQVDEANFIVTEFIEGITLRERFKRSRLPMTETLHTATQVADALAAAHAARIVHRDIKPENIMLRHDSYVKVLDFGLAKLNEQMTESDPTALTQAMVETEPGMVLGTTRYMSPEQARGLEVDERTDVWSLGVVLYEMVAGRVPFDGRTVTDVVISIVEGEPSPLGQQAPDAPTEIEWIVSKALAKEREERYQNIKSMLADLRRLKQRLDFATEVGGAAPLELSRASVPLSSRANSATGNKRPATSKVIDSLAILPLVNTSGDPHAEYLSDGITESIINSLSQLPRLRVVPRTTVFRYKGSNADPSEVGRNLNVRAVLTGRVVQRGDTLNVQTDLIDVVRESQLWGEQYNRKLSDIFIVQEEISREISSKLRLRLTGKDRKRLTKRYTENAEAYRLYLQGRYQSNKRTEEGLKRSIECFNQAIGTDPHYALAYAGLADSYNLLHSYSILPPTEVFPKAKAAALKALEMDDTLAEAHTSLAKLLVLEEDYRAAEKAYKRAIKLNPKYATAHHWYAICLQHLGRSDEAVAEAKRAEELDPLSVVISTSLGLHYFFARRYDEAVKQLHEAIEIDSSYYAARGVLGLAYEQLGMVEQAIEELETAVRLSDDDPEVLAFLGHAYAKIGRRSEAQRVLDSLKELSARRHFGTYHTALIHAALGDNDLAFELLERAGGAFDETRTFLKIDPRLDELRSDPKFDSLINRVRLAP